MRNKCPNIRVLQGPIYTCTKMRIYAGLVNHVVYAVYDSNENYFN